MRDGAVHAVPGYDGEYGVINIFSEEERAEVLGQIQLFNGWTPEKKKRPRAIAAPMVAEPAPAYEVSHPQGLSEEQQRAVDYPRAPLLIIAGPGAGKTRTLVERMSALIDTHGADPAGMLALTFSNRAAREMAERLEARLTPLQLTARPTVATFHKLGHLLIAEHAELLDLATPLSILAEDEAAELFAAVEGVQSDTELSNQPVMRRTAKLITGLDDLEQRRSPPSSPRRPPIRRR